MLKVQLTVQVVKSLPCPIHPGKGVVRHNTDRCIILGYSIASSSCVAKGVTGMQEITLVLRYVNNFKLQFYTVCITLCDVQLPIRTSGLM